MVYSCVIYYVVLLLCKKPINWRNEGNSDAISSYTHKECTSKQHGQKRGGRESIFVINLGDERLMEFVLMRASCVELCWQSSYTLLCVDLILGCNKVIVHQLVRIEKSDI
jgi:hypothetical protein